MISQRKTFIIVLSTIIFILFPNQIAAQTEPLNMEELENLFEDALLDEEESDFYIRIEELLENKLNINSAPIELMLRIPFIDHSIFEKIIQYRIEFGKIFSFDELKSLDGIDDKTFRLITLFFALEDLDTKSDFNYSKFDFEFRSRAISDLQDKEGIINGRYPGSALKSYQRVKINFEDKLQVKALIEKDAGETSFYDFSTFAVEVNDLLYFDNIIVGGFVAEFGMGLVNWAPYAISKGTEPVYPLIKGGNGINSFVSSEENNFFSGIAVKKTFTKNLDVSTYYSSKSVDASVTDDSFSSLNYTGYHRTESELRNNDALNEINSGIMLGYRISKTNLNLLFHHTEFDKSFTPNNNLLPTGKEFNYASLAYNTRNENIFINGETAYSFTNFATINSIQFSILKNFSIVFSQRYYSPNYFSFHANGFSESGINNETGYYAGVKFRNTFGDFACYYDVYSFPKGNNSTKLQLSGRDFLFNYEKRIFENSTIAVRYKTEKKEDVFTENLGDKIVASKTTDKYRINLTYQPNKKIKLKTRIELSRYKDLGATENGLLLYQDFSSNPYPNLYFIGRIILFDTDSYNSRIYEFENDLVGVMTNAPLYGKGVRWYGVIKYHLLNNYIVGIKYSETFKPEVDSFGSGNDEMKGNIQSRLAMQIDIRF
ncbi:MAG: helix-hairpin-helix domain-containing protein [Bacteroidota bacterium]